MDIDTLLNFDEPYLDDNVYDRISDHIIGRTFTHKGPIKREKIRNNIDENSE